MPFEHPPDRQWSDQVDHYVGTAFGVMVSVWLYAVIGLFTRKILQLSYLNTESVYDTWLSRVVQDMLLGILTLMGVGAILSGLYILLVIIRDTDFSSRTVHG